MSMIEGCAVTMEYAALDIDIKRRALSEMLQRTLCS